MAACALFAASLATSFVVSFDSSASDARPTRAAMEDAMGGHIGFALTAAQVADMPLCNPATHAGGNLQPYMPTTGAHPEIGVVTGDAVKMVASGLDPHAVASVYSTADCSINWPVHIADRKTGDRPAKPWLNAKQASTDDHANLIEDAQPNPAKLTPDIPHQPHFLATAAELAILQNDQPRFARYLVEMKSWVSFNFLHVPAQSRGPTGAEGLFDPEASANQPRGAAWGLVALVQLYDVMALAKSHGVPFVDDGWFAWTRRAVEANIHYYEHKYHLGDYDESYAKPYYDRPKGWAKNELGILATPDETFGRGRDGQTAVISGFSQAFQSWAVLWLARIAPRLPLADASRAELVSLATWAARWPVTMFGDSADPQAWPWQYAGTYTVAVGRWGPDGRVAFAKDGGAMYALQSALPRPTGNAFLVHDSTERAGPFGDYFVANVWPALVYAADLKADGAAAALARATASDQWKAGAQIAPAFAWMVDGRSFTDPPNAAAPAHTAAQAARRRGETP